MLGIVSGLKDISAAKELSKIADPGVQHQLNSAEYNFQKLLVSLNKSMEDASSQKQSRDWDKTMSQNGDEESEF
jgi:hypothetical protein